MQPKKIAPMPFTWIGVKKCNLLYTAQTFVLYNKCQF